MSETLGTVHLLRVRSDSDPVSTVARPLDRQHANLTVSTATCAGDAFDLLADAPVDCILADHRPPDMDGIEFLSELRATWPLVPVILLSGEWDADLARRTVQNGGSDFIAVSGPDQPRQDLISRRILNAVENYRNQQSREIEDYRLRTARARFRQLFEHSPNCIAFTEYLNGQPIIRQINPAFEEVFGYQPADAVGENLNELIVPDQLMDEARQLDQEAVGKPWIERELKRETAEGELRDFLFRGAQVTTGTGTIEGYVIYSDITDRKRWERRLERERDLKEAVRRILVENSAQNEREEAFCDRITEEGYPLAWIGDRSSADTVTVRASAGRDSYLDAVGEITLDGGEPSAAALSGMDTVVIQDVTAADGGWAETAAAEGLYSAMAVPTVHEGFRYGTLAVYSSEKHAFTDERRRLIEEFAEALAFAIHAAKQRESLHTNRPREVTFDVRGGRSYLVSIAGDERLPDDARLHVHQVRTDADDGSVHFVRAEGGESFDFGAFLESFDPVTDTELVSALEGGRIFKLVVQSPDIGSEIVAQGGMVDSITVSRDSLQVTARFPRRVDIEQTLGQLRETFPGTGITSLTHAETDPDPGIRPHPELSEKQLSAVTTAYYGGFFDRPQGRTAGELASTLGASRTTFLKHLRRAEATIIGQFVGQYTNIGALEGS